MLSNVGRTLGWCVVLAGVLMVGSALASIRATAEADRPVVQTRTGAVRGIVQGRIGTFLGIPYAEPPVGPLRWRPPVPHTPWRETRDATRFGSICPQPATAQRLPASSEDCLFLNVYAPASRGAGRRPVMVWVHGGTNTTGAGSFYDPAPLIEAGDVVVVTLNYRLGALGFLAHPAFRAEAGTTGNYGLADQQQALRWVRSNIAAFGGDPGNVTLFGESSGGMNALNLLQSPGAAGLFQKVIVESGTFLLDTASLAKSEAQGRTFATQIGCPDQSAGCLRTRSVKEVLDNQGNAGGAVVAFELATVDGTLLPMSLREALVRGRFHRVPIMIGNNSQEGRLFVPPSLPADAYQPTLEKDAVSANRPVAGAVASYPLAAYATPFDGASAAFGDSVFACTDHLAERLLGARVPTFGYEFADTAGDAASSGPTHGSELRYLFDMDFMGPTFDGGPAGLPGPSRDLALAMRRYWTSFARSGAPGAPDLPTWPGVGSGTVERLAAPRPEREALETFDVQHRCAYWNGTEEPRARAPQPRGSTHSRRADE